MLLKVMTNTGDAKSTYKQNGALFPDDLGDLALAVYAGLPKRPRTGILDASETVQYSVDIAFPD
jgi:hypothetical protein